MGTERRERLTIGVQREEDASPLGYRERRTPHYWSTERGERLTTRVGREEDASP